MIDGARPLTPACCPKNGIAKNQEVRRGWLTGECRGRGDMTREQGVVGCPERVRPLETRPIPYSPCPFFLSPPLAGRAYTAIHIIPCISWASLNSSFLSSLHLSAYRVHIPNFLARRRIVALLGREEPQTHIDKIGASDFAQEHPASFSSASPLSPLSFSILLAARASPTTQTQTRCARLRYAHSPPPSSAQVEA